MMSRFHKPAISPLRMVLRYKNSDVCDALTRAVDDRDALCTKASMILASFNWPWSSLSMSSFGSRIVISCVDSQSMQGTHCCASSGSGTKPGRHAHAARVIATGLENVSAGHAVLRWSPVQKKFDAQGSHFALLL